MYARVYGERGYEDVDGGQIEAVVDDGQEEYQADDCYLDEVNGCHDIR